MNLDDLFAFPLDVFPFVFLALAAAFSVHECSHAWFAWKFGDDTAKNQGRVTLNPRRHLDVFGTILIFIAGFGWAKPVPVMRSKFKYPRLMGIIVSAAGPLSNLLLAFVALLLWYVLLSFGFNPETSRVNEAIHVQFNILISLNLILFIFNLIPVPPLDGYRIIADIVPQQTRARLSQIEHWGVFIFLLLVFIPPLRRITIDPLFSLQIDLYQGMVKLILKLFGAWG
ncbi:MAG TPA: site-2 protease family protein [Bacilli bacterium]